MAAGSWNITPLKCTYTASSHCSNPSQYNNNDSLDPFNTFLQNSTDSVTKYSTQKFKRGIPSCPSTRQYDPLWQLAAEISPHWNAHTQPALIAVIRLNIFKRILWTPSTHFCKILRTLLRNIAPKIFWGESPAAPAYCSSLPQRTAARCCQKYCRMYAAALKWQLAATPPLPQNWKSCSGSWHYCHCRCHLPWAVITAFRQMTALFGGLSEATFVECLNQIAAKLI